MEGTKGVEEMVGVGEHLSREGSPPTGTGGQQVINAVPRKRLREGEMAEGVRSWQIRGNRRGEVNVQVDRSAVGGPSDGPFLIAVLTGG